MPYDGMGNYIESKADNTSDVIGFGDVGGIGQLIYHTFRFKDYEFEVGAGESWYLKPTIYKGMEPDLDKENGFSGKEIFRELYNLGRKINDFSEEKPYVDLIIEFCKDVAHPYYIDTVYSLMTDKQFDIADDGEMLERESLFSLSTFMHDLERFYTAAQFYFALKKVCAGDGDDAFDLAQEGKFFEGLPFFEKYKHEENFQEYKLEKGEITPQQLLHEMIAEQKKTKHREQKEVTWFAREPFDYYEELREQLMDMIPDFHMRLKINPRNNQVVFAADVHSVFDICWYTLARMLVDFGPPEEGGRIRELNEGAIITCLHCAEAFIRDNNRQLYCKKVECQRAHNAARQRKYRANKKLAETKAKNKK